MTISTRKITAFAKTIAALADAPALGSSALLKAWFDSSPEELRVEINGVIDDLLAVAPGASGADNIGSAPITGVTGTTVYTQLVALKNLLDTLTAGTGIADLSITTSKIALLAITAAQIANGTITSTQLADGTIMDVDINTSAAISWSKISKTASSLLDLATRSASDLSSGTLNVARLPTAIPATSIGNGDVTNAILSFLNSLTSNAQTQLDAKVPLSQKGVANGVASLDSGAKVPIAQLPDAVVGALEYQGTWNASTNTPTLPSPSASKGFYYVVSTAGTQFSLSYNVGDWAISNGVIWDKVDNTDAVPTVFGRTGNILAATNDYTWPQIDKTTSSLADLTTRSASDLNSGTLPVGRVPTGIPALSIGTGTVDNTKLGYLSTVTSDVQAQITARANEIGTLSNSTTTDKSSLINISNEINLRRKDIGYNVKDYNASGSSQSTTGSITSGTNALTLASAIDFAVGQGISAYGIYEVASLSVTAGATSSANCTITLNGVSYTVALTSGNTATQVATAIRATSFAGWTTGGSGTTVTFTSNVTGNKTDATYSAGTTGATGTMTTTTQGTADLISSITAINGLVLTLANNASTTVSGVVVTHDDTVAIQSAVNAANTSSGGRVLFPIGTYFISAQITLYSNITLEGLGSASAIKAKNNFAPSGLSPMIWADTKSDIAILNLLIDGNAANQSGTDNIVGVGGYKVTRYRVQNCHIINTYGIMAEFSNCIHVIFDSNILDTNTTLQPGVVFLADTIGFQNSFSVCSNNIIRSVIADAISITGTASLSISYVNVVGNVIYNSGFMGDGVDGAGIYMNYAADCTVTGNECAKIGGNGIDISTGRNLSIVGNDVSIVGRAGIMFDAVSYSAMNDNVVTNTVQKGNDTLNSSKNFKSGLYIGNNCSHINITGNISTDNQGTKTQQYGLLCNDTNNNNINIYNNDLSGNLTSAANFVNVPVSCYTSKNNAYNPFGNVTAPSIPTSGSNYTNPFPYACRIFVTGASIAALYIGGINVGVTATALANGVMLVLEVGETVKMDYTGTPSWKWFGM